MISSQVDLSEQVQLHLIFEHFYRCPSKVKRVSKRYLKLKVDSSIVVFT